MKTVQKTKKLKLVSKIWFEHHSYYSSTATVNWGNFGNRGYLSKNSIQSLFNNFRFFRFLNKKKTSTLNSMKRHNRAIAMLFKTYLDLKKNLN